MIYILSEKEFEGAENLPCIMIAYKDVSLDVSDYDALIFSSKNGVYAVDRLDAFWKHIPSYAIGSGTSKAVESLGGEVVYRAKSSYGDDFAREIKERLRGKKALFLRAQVVTSSLNVILKEAGVLLEEVVVYETKCTPCKQLQEPQEDAIVIFSSPSTIRCFFNCFSWKKSYTAVVIGAVTASYMPKDIPFIKSKKQTIASCIELAKDLSKKGL